jgi:phage FluMu protein Com
VTEYRCRRCGRLLFRADADGRVEIVCPNRQCRTFQMVTVAASQVSLAATM